MLQQLSNTAKTKPKTVDGIKKDIEFSFRNIQNDKRSNSKFHEKYIFTKQLNAKLNARVRSNDTLVKARKSATFGDKSLAKRGTKIWNALKQSIKAENFYVKLEKYIAT